MKNVKKLVRPQNGRWVAGVCVGLANYLGIDVTVVRLIWIFLLLPGGVPGLLPYLIMWMVVPEEG